MAPIDIPTEQARRERPSGWDVYDGVAFHYCSAINQAVSALLVYREAVQALCDTIQLVERELVRAELAAELAYVASGATFVERLPPQCPTLRRVMQYRHLENLKVGSCFEAYLKARLLESGYVVHRIDHAISPILARQQRRRPISWAEVCAGHELRFNGTHNHMPALRLATIEFSTITQRPEYRAALEVAPES